MSRKRRGTHHYVTQDAANDFHHRIGDWSGMNSNSNDAARIAALHTISSSSSDGSSAPSLRPLLRPDWCETVIPWIVGVMVGLVLVYQTLFRLLDRIVIVGSEPTPPIVRPELRDDPKKNRSSTTGNNTSTRSRSSTGTTGTTGTTGSSDTNSDTTKIVSTPMPTSNTNITNTDQQQQHLFSVTLAQKRKLCFQGTNLVTNLGFGLAGLVCERQLQRDAVPWLSYTGGSSTVVSTIRTLLIPLPATVEETIQGYDHFTPFSAAQIGYQLWSLALLQQGMSQEPPYMILHHVAVIVGAVMAACFQLGFRYWTPFFYGLVEVSTVPLAIMNAFQDQPTHRLIARYPVVYRNVRLCFAVSFLTLRVVLFVPRQCFFLHRHYLLWSSRPSHRTYQVYMATVWISSFFLLVLQLYWAVLVGKGLVRLFVGRDSSRRHSRRIGTSSMSSPALKKTS